MLCALRALLWLAGSWAGKREAHRRAEVRAVSAGSYFPCLLFPLPVSCAQEASSAYQLEQDEVKGRLAEEYNVLKLGLGQRIAGLEGAVEAEHQVGAGRGAGFWRTLPLPAFWPDNRVCGRRQRMSTALRSLSSLVRAPSAHTGLAL